MNVGAEAPRIFVSAGEPSGDLHGAALVESLRDRFPGARITGFGGPRMAAAGAELRWRMEGFTALGLVEVVGKIPRHWRLLGQMRRLFDTGTIDLVIVVDYPGFHLRVAEAAKAAGIPVLYYVAPQLWAWWPGRARRLAKAVDAMAVILPFEAGFFRTVGIEAEFVGHPLTETSRPSRAAARQALGIGPAVKVLGLFPGSREGELHRLWPAFRDAGRRLLEGGRCEQVVVAGTVEGRYPDPGPVTLMRGETTAILAAADAGLAKSGTTTLEAALSDLPMVVAYRVHPVTARLARRMLRVEWLSLVNLVAGRQVVPELWQDEVTGVGLERAVSPLLDATNPVTTAQREGLAEVRDKLGGAGAASRVAAMAARLLAR
ncbi:MAG TPA: lipid-A-disaccharide synthase [Gemmatimonadales bacterium]|nr:lipid-A-disaccharide synthase [Gemmatimonadales bacterium]